MFAVIWAIYRHKHFAWIGQDILVGNISILVIIILILDILMTEFLLQGIALIITVLQIVHVPNLKVLLPTHCLLTDTKKDQNSPNLIFFFLSVLFLLHFHQVGTVLLSCAFVYDIFWVFISKALFHESVMIVVGTPLKVLKNKLIFL